MLYSYMTVSMNMLPSCAAIISLISVAIMLHLTPSSAFLFPDLKFRTGGQYSQLRSPDTVQLFLLIQTTVTPSSNPPTLQY